MRKYGLLGRKLSHTFSPKYFADKFSAEGIYDTRYDAYEIAEEKHLLTIFDRGLSGFNVTIPYKETIMPLLAGIDAPAKIIGAVNCVKKTQSGYIGYNTDWVGFRDSLTNFIDDDPNLKALVLGYGGAAKAVRYALHFLNLPFTIVSRQGGHLHYDQLTAGMVNDHRLVINTTSVGMSPHEDNCLDLPYDGIGKYHMVYDLIYNPVETLMLRKAKANGANVKNGYEMLVGQAEESWKIWTSGID